MYLAWSQDIAYVHRPFRLCGCLFHSSFLSIEGNERQEKYKRQMNQSIELTEYKERKGAQLEENRGLIRSIDVPLSRVNNPFKVNDTRLSIPAS